MPVKLTHPYQTVTLDMAKVAAIKIEENPSVGSRWIEIWAVLGRMEEGVFVQYADPKTGQLAWRYFKIEDGRHPLLVNVGLGKCATCSQWLRGQTSGQHEGCGGTVAPYDGWERLSAQLPVGANIREAIARAVYGFLLTEVVPDPDTWELAKLIDGTLE
jgi:hypothetical protein